MKRKHFITKETSSELKLTDFQEKSCRPKSSTLWAVGAGDCSQTRSSLDHFREPTNTRQPIPQEKPRLKHPEEIPPKLFERERQHPLLHSITYQP
jgi:hypothetical protein